MKLVTELAPENAGGFLNLGILYYSTRRYPEAESALRKSIGLQPLATAYTDLGTIQFFQHRYSESVISFEQAVHLGPNDAYNWGNLADSLRQIPLRRKEAEEDYRRAIQLASQQLALNPNNPDLRGSLALYLAKAGNKKESLTEISSALNLGSRNVNIQFNAAQVYEISGDHALAIRHLEDALAHGYPADEVRQLPEFAGLRENPVVKKLLSHYEPQN
jgi:tetratricopeptide (TPR) repeat protein